MQVMLSIEETG